MLKLFVDIFPSRNAGDSRQRPKTADYFDIPLFDFMSQEQLACLLPSRSQSTPFYSKRTFQKYHDFFLRPNPDRLKIRKLWVISSRFSNAKFSGTTSSRFWIKGSIDSALVKEDWLINRIIIDLDYCVGILIVHNGQGMILILIYPDVQNSSFSITIGLRPSFKVLIDSLLSVEGSSDWNSFFFCTSNRFFVLGRKCR